MQRAHLIQALLRNLGKKASTDRRENRARTDLRDLERFRSRRATPMTQTAVSCRCAEMRAKP